MSDYESCAVCGKRQNAALNLTQEIFQINTTAGCGHKFCEMCVEKTFNRKRQISCPICKLPVTKEKLSKKTLDETEVERDFRVRRRIKAIFNRSEESFSLLLEFNDYEEMVEDIIFNLVHGIDESSTEQRVREYESEHIQQIAEYQSKQSEALRKERELIEAEEDERMKRIEETLGNLEKEKKDRLEHSRQWNELLLGERDEITVAIPKPTEYSKAKSSHSVAAPAAGPATVHPLLLLLAQRPEPAALHAGKKRKNWEASSDIAAVQSAGGFDRLHYFRRNWREITTGLLTLQRKQTCGGLQANICWPLSWD